jgi:hypothetical protein
MKLGCGVVVFFFNRKNIEVYYRGKSMIKSAIRWSAKIGLVGSVILTSWFGQPGKVLALPQQDVIQTLSTVPVFTIADSQGAPLVASGEGDVKVAGIFISQQDANNFVAKLKQQNPEIGNKVQVIPDFFRGSLSTSCRK